MKESNQKNLSRVSSQIYKGQGKLLHIAYDSMFYYPDDQGFLQQQVVHAADMTVYNSSNQRDFFVHKGRWNGECSRKPGTKRQKQYGNWIFYTKEGSNLKHNGGTKKEPYSSDSKGGELLCHIVSVIEGKWDRYSTVDRYQTQRVDGHHARQHIDVSGTHIYIYLFFKGFLPRKTYLPKKIYPLNDFLVSQFFCWTISWIKKLANKNKSTKQTIGMEMLLLPVNVIIHGIGVFFW